MTSNNPANNSGKKVIIGLTGRLDSAVAAFLLKKQGFHVIGIALVSMNGANQKNQINDLPTCHIEDLTKIQKLCEQIKIPFYASDIKAQFEDQVLDKMLSHQIEARANTTCFNCTKLRIDTLYQKMLQLNADFIATGHYCKVYKNLTSDEYFIHSNNDQASDQSFLLAGLEKQYLERLLLPLGELRKDEVQKISQNFGLQVEPSRSHQHFCFNSRASKEDIIRKKIPKDFLQEGQIVNIENDLVIGDHEGIPFHFISEQNFAVRGTTLLDKNFEIVDYDHKNATIKVGTKKHLTFSGTQVFDLHISTAYDRRKPIQCFLKYKYDNTFIKCDLYFKNNQSAYLEFEKPVYPLIPGEIIALYDSNGRNAKIIVRATIGNRGDFKLIDRAVDYRHKGEEHQDHQVSMFRF
jgi:tRNA-uridine 2-sulfurtransferase